MVRFSVSGAGVRRLEMFQGGGVKQWLLVGGLLVLMVGSLVFFLVNLFGKKTPEQKGPKAAPVVCVKCNAKYMPEKSQFIALRMIGEVGGGAGKPKGADCVKCGAVGTCYRMVRCPKCDEIYEEKWIRLDRFPNPEDRDRVCPKCGHVERKWREPGADVPAPAPAQP